MTTEEKLIKNKLGLLELANYLKNVSEACRVMGYSRDTFYRAKHAYDEGGIEALKEKTRRTPRIRNRVPESVEQAIIDLSLEDPSFLRPETAQRYLKATRNLHFRRWRSLRLASS